VVNINGVVADNTDGVTTGAGGLVKTGPAILSLNAANTYSGGTTVNVGTLRVNNTTGSGTGPGPVTVNSGGSLGGGGTISSTVTINFGGTLAPGNSPGKLTVGGGVTMAGGSTYSVELNGTAPGTGHDQLAVGGQFDPGSAVLSASSTFGSFAPADVLQIVTFGTITGNRFAGLPDGGTLLFGSSGLPPATPFYTAQINYGTLTGFANAVTLTNFQPVPEPVHILLVSGVLAAGTCWRRHRRALTAVP
jgi:autotransporter-associated beta strand protein